MQFINVISYTNFITVRRLLNVLSVCPQFCVYCSLTVAVYTLNMEGELDLVASTAKPNGPRQSIEAVVMKFCVPADNIQLLLKQLYVCHIKQ